MGGGEKGRRGGEGGEGSLFSCPAVPREASSRVEKHTRRGGVAELSSSGGKVKWGREGAQKEGVMERRSEGEVEGQRKGRVVEERRGTGGEEE